MEKKIQRYLKKIQDDAHPIDDESNADPGSKKKAKEAKKLRTHISATRDWPFFVLLSVAILKDLYDVISAGLLTDAIGGGGINLADIAKELGVDIGTILAGLYAGGIPGLILLILKILKWSYRAYQIVASIIGAFKAGINLAAALIAPPIMNIMFQIVALSALLVSGSTGIFTRWKTVIALTMVEFVCETFFGLNWLPWTTMYVIFLYYFVLRKRKKKTLKQDTAI